MNLLSENLKKSLPLVLGLSALIGSVGLVYLCVWYGELNQDEGWYLYAAHLVSAGQKPYFDFAFTQAPLLPFVYSLAEPLILKQGVLAGRLLTLGFGLFSILLIAWVGLRQVKKEIRWFVFFLILLFLLLNVYQIYYFSLVKTYALTSLWIALGAVLLSESLRVEKYAWVLGFASGAMMALAASTRLSALFILPAVFVPLWLGRRLVSKKLAWSFFVGSTLVLVSVLGPFLIYFKTNHFLFWIYDFHKQRVSENGLLYRAGFIASCAQAYLVMFVVLVLALVWKGLSGASEIKRYYLPEEILQRKRKDLFLWILWLSVFLVSAVHFVSPFPYTEYQSFLIPLFVLAMVLTLVKLYSAELQKKDFRLWILLSVFLFSMASAFSSPLHQSWLVAGRHLIWWPSRQSSQLDQLRTLGKEVRENQQTDAHPFEKEILTFDPYLAVEAKMKLPSGLAMGPFSYYPDFSDSEAEAYHVVNSVGLDKILKNSPAKIAMMSEYAFGIANPKIISVSTEAKEYYFGRLEERYVLTRTVSNFAQGNTLLRVYLQR